MTRRRVTPNELVSELLRIARKIDLSSRPSRSLVAADLRVALSGAGDQLLLPIDLGPSTPRPKIPREEVNRYDDKIQLDHDLGLLDDQDELGDYDHDRGETEPWLA